MIIVKWAETILQNDIYWLSLTSINRILLYKMDIYKMYDRNYTVSVIGEVIAITNAGYFKYYPWKSLRRKSCHKDAKVQIDQRYKLTLACNEYIY